MVNGAERESNKRVIDELQGISRQYPRRPDPKAQVSLAAVASDRKGREEKGGRRMNNIGSANVVILKRPVVEETDNYPEDHLTYPITITTQSQKPASSKVSGTQKPQPISQTTKPAQKNLGKVA